MDKFQDCVYWRIKSGVLNFCGSHKMMNMISTSRCVLMSSLSVLPNSWLNNGKTGASTRRINNSPFSFWSNFRLLHQLLWVTIIHHNWINSIFESCFEVLQEGRLYCRPHCRHACDKLRARMHNLSYFVSHVIGWTCHECPTGLNKPHS